MTLLFSMFMEKDRAIRLRLFFRDQPKVFKLWDPPLLLSLYRQEVVVLSFFGA